MPGAFSRGTHLEIEAVPVSNMSLLKIPFILLEAISTHRIASPPDPTAERTHGGLAAYPVLFCSANTRVSISSPFLQKRFPNLGTDLFPSSIIGGLQQLRKPFSFWLTILGCFRASLLHGSQGPRTPLPLLPISTNLLFSSLDAPLSGSAPSSEQRPIVN